MHNILIHNIISSVCCFIFDKYILYVLGIYYELTEMCVPTSDSNNLQVTVLCKLISKICFTVIDLILNCIIPTYFLIEKILVVYNDLDADCSHILRKTINNNYP